LAVYNFGGSNVVQTYASFALEFAQPADDIQIIYREKGALVCDIKRNIERRPERRKARIERRRCRPRWTPKGINCHHDGKDRTNNKGPRGESASVTRSA
jgi:hypothetical protein